jgi:tetratricopeptide (TPR) repeat protein
MTVNFVIIILVIAICSLLGFLLRKVILAKRASTATNLADRSKILQAVRAAKAAVEKNPQDAEARYLLGKAYLADKRDEQAFREYRSASRIGIEGANIPETEFRETIAGLYARFHEEEEALKEYVLLIKKNPEKPDYYFHAGKLFSNRRRSDLAEQYLRKAVSLNPREGSYRIELGMHYYLAKKLKEAEGEFEAALKQNPADGNALLYIGKIRKDAKDYAGAVPYLEKASRDQEYKLRALVELGACYMSLKMVDKAIGELERAVNVIEKEDDADSLYARYFLAMCFEKNQDFNKAVAQWEKIYAQKKNFRDVGEKLTQYIEYRLESSAKETARKS